MDQSPATVSAYLANLPDDRREAITRLRELILQELPEGYEESIQYDMISYNVPLATFRETYNGLPLSYIAIASQKHYMSLYLMGVYGDNEKQFRDAYSQTGKKLNMGKSCVRFKRYEDLPEELIRQTVASYTPEQFVERYRELRG